MKLPTDIGSLGNINRQIRAFKSNVFYGIMYEQPQLDHSFEYVMATIILTKKNTEICIYNVGIKLNRFAS